MRPVGDTGPRLAVELPQLRPCGDGPNNVETQQAAEQRHGLIGPDVCETHGANEATGRTRDVPLKASHPNTCRTNEHSREYMEDESCCGRAGRAA